LSFAGWGSSVSISLAVATAQSVVGGAVRLASLDIENILGGSGADTLRGGTGSGTVDGGAGNDVLQAWAGADTFIGGGGNDLLTFAAWNFGVTVSLALSGVQAVAGGSVRIAQLDIENLTGGHGSDVLTGSAVANRLNGGLGGNDVLNGGD